MNSGNREARTGETAAAPPEKPFFCFTLDTEPDNLWEPFTGLHFEHFNGLFEFHRDLAARGAKPVYLTTSEVAESPRASRVMEKILETGQAELGAHFHTWTREWPFEVPALGTPPLQAMAHQLGQGVEERMLEFTCGILERRFGIRPRSYRGGRWSFNPATLDSLLNTGILVDTTVTPGLSWRDPRHPLLDGPDFRASPRFPFYLRSGGSRPAASGGDVLELPVGSSFLAPGRLGARAGLVGRLARRFAALVGRPSGQLWLRPTSMSRTQSRACLEALRRDGVPVWVSMIHSSEIIPCKKFPDRSSVQRFRTRCLQLVEDARALGATCATLDEVRHAYDHAATRSGPDLVGSRGRDGDPSPDPDDRATDRADFLRHPG